MRRTVNAYDKGAALADQVREKVAGILGGMGPEATVDLMHRIIRLTPADDDIDHIRCIVDNNPKVPSRIKAIIEGGGEDPGPCLAEMARKLETWGADFLVIPCNTAHYYYSYVQRAVKIPVINLIDIAVDEFISNHGDLSSAGILASTAVIMTGLYEKRFKSKAIDVVYPDAMHQQRLLGVIKNIKAGRTGKDTRQAFGEICENLAEKGVQSAIIACTELGVIGDNLPIHTIDAAELLAREIVAVVKEGKEIENG